MSSSTRQPFVPARAPSRTTSGSAAQDKPVESRFDFTASVSEVALPENTNSQNQELDQANGDGVGGGGNVLGTINKPLNLAGFTKRKNRPEQQVFSAIAAKSRRSFDGATPARPPSAAQNHPRPFSPLFAHNQGALSAITRMPRHSSPSRLQSTNPGDDLSSNQAHIVTSRPVALSGDDTDNPRQLPFGSSAPSLRISARSSLEKIQESAEEEDQGVRQQFFGMSNGANGASLTHPEASGNPSSELQRGAKRMQHPETDVEDEYEYQPAMKRYKPSRVVQNMEEYAYDRSSPMYRQESEEPRPLPNAQPPAFQDFAANQSSVQLAAQATEENALRKLLGQDLDKYISEHLDAYDEAKKKWSECSAEEWQAGAEELMGKFAKMLDFVKDHMKTKIGLYSTLHAQATNHRTVLSEREKKLNKAQESLVHSGGKMIKSGPPSTTKQNEGDAIEK